MSYTTGKPSREIKAKLEKYARARRLTLSGASDRLLEEEKVEWELKKIEGCLRNRTSYLIQISEELG